MQAKCPKCGATAFRMLPESQRATEVECLNCSHVAPFASTVTDQSINKRTPLQGAPGGEEY